MKVKINFYLSVFFSFFKLFYFILFFILFYFILFYFIKSVLIFIFLLFVLFYFIKSVLIFIFLLFILFYYPLLKATISNKTEMAKLLIEYVNQYQIFLELL